MAEAGSPGCLELTNSQRRNKTCSRGASSGVSAARMVGKVVGMVRGDTHVALARSVRPEEAGGRWRKVGVGGGARGMHRALLSWYYSTDGLFALFIKELGELGQSWAADSWAPGKHYPISLLPAGSTDFGASVGKRY